MFTGTIRTIAEARDAMDRILRQNIVPFWLARLGEPAGNGFRLHHDAGGRWKGPAPKRLVKQARALWFLARLMRADPAAPDCAVLAAQGFEFLRDRLWDAEFGGFYWEVDDAGECATMGDKHVYGHAHALYAVCEYAVASGCKDARQLAGRIFDLLEERFRDPVFGGYREFFRRDWMPCPEEARGYLGASPELKLLNSNLHLLEGMIAYDRLTGGAPARQRLLELMDILGRAMIREPEGACTDGYRRDWTPLRGGRNDRVSYGHDLENIHLLIAAHERTGTLGPQALEICRRLFCHAARFGFDDREGGFFASGPLGTPADDLRKIWWVQAEALLAALELYRVCGAPFYFHHAVRTVDWLVRRQVDWTHGDWHAEIASDGRPEGDKAGPWKGPYHHGRAMIQGLEILDRIS